MTVAVGELTPVLSVMLQREVHGQTEAMKFELAAGERVFVVGANGTGKSALLHKLQHKGGKHVLRIDAQRLVGFQMVCPHRVVRLKC